MTEIWGPNTWELFHNLANKIKDHNFQKIIPYVWNNILFISNNLPCPHCRNHASMHLGKVDSDTIYNKQIFIELLFRFHNMVSYKVNKKIENIDVLEKYDNIKLIDSINRFKISWFNVTKRMTLRELKNQVKYEKVVKYVVTWLTKNKNLFKDFE